MYNHENSHMSESAREEAQQAFAGRLWRGGTVPDTHAERAMIVDIEAREGVADIDFLWSLHLFSLQRHAQGAEAAYARPC